LAMAYHDVFRRLQYMSSVRAAAFCYWCMYKYTNGGISAFGLKSAATTSIIAFT